MCSHVERVLGQLEQAWTAGQLDLPGPRTLIHGDFSAKNALFIDAGATAKVLLFDWQATAYAHPARDVATLIYHSLPADAWARDADQLLCFYCAAVAETGADLAYEELLHPVRRALLQRMAMTVLVGGAPAEPGPERAAIARRLLERAPVMLESFDTDQYLA